jgi:putative phosphoribosyl transferase
MTLSSTRVLRDELPWNYCWFVDGFADRIDAGRQLAACLEPLRDEADLVVLGLARGGVPVACEVALALGAPLDVLVVRKIGLPDQPEVAMGAVGEDGVVVVNEELVSSVHVPKAEFERIEKREQAELERRVRRYRMGREPIVLEGRTVVIVDDGMATGSTARAACQVAQARGAARVVLAVPVAAAQAMEDLRGCVDELVSLGVADGPFAVGQFYEEFDQTSDEQVSECLERANHRTRA